jgi:hypothetical protein
MRLLCCVLLAAVLAAPVSPQFPDPYSRVPERSAPGPKLPNGKDQRDEILKSDYQKSLKDLTTLLKEAEDLKAEMEKNEQYVLSVGSLKKLDNIEKLTKQIRSRMKRF